jgi:uncharacterized protein (TIRG00374 family)
VVLSWPRNGLTGAGGPADPRGHAIKKTLIRIIVFAVIVLALYLLLPRLVDTQATLQYISRASYFLLGVAVVLEVAALAGYANLFRYILRVLDIRMRLREVWAITLSGLAVSHILSAGGVGGWVVTYNALMKHRVPHGIIFVAIAAQQFFNYVVLWVFFALAIIYLIITRGSDSIFGYLIGIALIVLILWLTLYGVYLYNHPTRLRLRAHQIARLVNRVLRREAVKEHHIDGWIDNLLTGMRRMVRHRGSFRTTLLFACAFWFFDMLCLWCTFAAFGYTIGLSHLLVGYVVAYSIGTLAPTPGGLGAVEGILIALYVSFGVPSAVAVAVVLVYRIINFWLPIPPGFVTYAIVRPGRKPITEGEVEMAASEAPGELNNLDGRR